MIPEVPKAGKFRFRMVGGSLQLQIAAAEDIANVLTLDEALWAMTSVDTDSLRFDRRFLEFLDSDHDGKIRSNEIKDALNFLFAGFRNFDGVNNGDPELSISSLNPDAPGMEEVIRCAKLLLTGYGRTATDTLNAGDIRESRIVTTFTDRNGDGVIVPESDLTADLQYLVKMVIASGRKSLDRSGNDGISLADLESFEAALKRRLELLKVKDEDPEILIFGENSAELYQLFADCEPLLDGYFLNSATEEFLLTDPERAVKKEFSADLMVPADVRQALENAALAIPAGGGKLDISAPLNPLYAEKIRQLAASPVFAGHLDGSVLTEAEYRKIKEQFVPFAKWRQEITLDDGLTGFTVDELQKLAAIDSAELKELIASDLSFAPVVSAGETLLKLALFQQHMLKFLNNFVSLSELFNPLAPSHLQMGKLVMDGRHFTLAVKVKNPVEHKKIITTSNICVIYVEISRTNGSATLKQLLAVAVTSGTMRSLFIGKHGVFFDTDGVIYDAVIRDIAEQPVSIKEAFLAPFYRFADFISKQTEKIFNTRNAEVQKSMSAELNKSQLATVPKVPPAPGQKAPVPAAAPASAVPPSAPATGSNISMLLMGGGIGLAALGSSVAFIAKSLQNVSFTTILSVLIGIVVIFGGPSVIIALIKLFNRDLSRFLESCGCAVNHPMRLSRKMGLIFTFVPSRPAGSISLVDPVDVFHPVRKKGRSVLIIIIVLALLGGAGWGAWYIYRHRKAADTAEVCGKKESPEKTVCKDKVDGKNPEKTAEKKAEDSGSKADTENSVKTADEVEKTPVEKKKSSGDIKSR